MKHRTRTALAALAAFVLGGTVTFAAAQVPIDPQGIHRTITVTGEPDPDGPWVILASRQRSILEVLHTPTRAAGPGRANTHWANALTNAEAASRHWLHTHGHPVHHETHPPDMHGGSAGLTVALARVAANVTFDLTGGHRVAATGTITHDGHVGQVADVDVKTAAAEAAGATILIVPVLNVPDTAGTHLHVIAARTLAQVIDDLCAHTRSCHHPNPHHAPSS